MFDNIRFQDIFNAYIRFRRKVVFRFESDSESFEDLGRLV